MKIRIYYCPFDKKKESSRILLSLAAAADTGESSRFLQVSEHEHGKPYFPALPGLHFSITHSGGIWMCAFCDTGIGIDLQKHRECRMKEISRRYFHPSEDAFLKANGYIPFFDVWSAKESYLKYTGSGLPGGLGSFSVVGGDGVFPSVPGAVIRKLPFEEGWSLCCCFPAGCGPEIIFRRLEDGRRYPVFKE